eukprot:SAG11_NODE_4016_length_2106_cov_1.443448_2_plen_186_part_01
MCFRAPSVVLRVGQLGVNVFDKKLRALQTLMYQHTRVQIFPDRIFVRLRAQQDTPELSGAGPRPREIQFLGRSKFTDMSDLAFRWMDRIETLQAVHEQSLREAMPETLQAVHEQSLRKAMPEETSPSPPPPLPPPPSYDTLYSSPAPAPATQPGFSLPLQFSWSDTSPDEPCTIERRDLSQQRLSE